MRMPLCLWLLIVVSYHTLAYGAETDEVVAESAAVAAGKQNNGLFPCVEPILPPLFHVNQQVQSSGWSFKITGPSDKTDYGMVEEDLFAFDTTLTWVHKQEKVSNGVKSSVSFGSEIVIRDCQRKVIATIKERTFTGYATTQSEYRVLNAEGIEVAVSSRVEWSMLPHFVIKSPRETRTLASFKRPLVSWGDQWQITRHLTNATSSSKDALAQDPRVLVMLAVFKTATHQSSSKNAIWWIIIGGPLLLCCCFSLFIITVYKGLRKSAQEVMMDNFDQDLHDHHGLIKQEDFVLYKYNQV